MKNLFYPLFFLLTFVFTFSIVAQETFPQNGVYDQREGLYAFTNATIYTSYNQKIDQATLLIRNGKIVAVGASVAVPSEAVVIDAKGKFIYPSFIDVYSDYGIKEEDKKGGAPSSRRTQQMLSKKEGAYSWNEALRSEFKAHENFDVDNSSAKDYRSIGFGSLLSHRMDGISRGSSTFVTLGEDRAHKVILKESASHHLALKKGSSKQSYPGSLMGGIALLRQTYLDGVWYENHGKKKETNLSLQAWNDLQKLPQIFEVRDVQEALRASKLAKEYKVNYTIHGAGDEYKMLDEIKSTGATYILPLDFPKAFDVEDPYDALLVSLGQLKHWELAPSNPARLAEAGINIILTTNQLKDKSQFLSQLQKAIKYGLSAEIALKALTMTPAQLLGVDKMVGSLEKGKQANFLITSDKIFAKGTKIHHNWIQGKPHIFSDLATTDLTGNYNLNIGRDNYALQVSGEKPEMKIIVNDSTNISVKHTYKDGVIGLVFSPSKEEDQKIRLTGTLDGKDWSGGGSLINGDWIAWEAIYSSPPEETDKKDKKGKGKKKEKDENEIGDVIYPFVAYGQKTLPKTENYLIKNATVWTNEKEGILENTDVLISNGKVKQIGKSLNIKDAITIDASGKHLTCGIVDEHSHIAISRGVNECTQANTAEVRIGDVIDAQDIDIYRQLAGGVTTSQLLHGSCNPVGGQSAIIKLRWGYSPEKMKFENSDGFIKFALGENVKKSRSSDNNRFPDSRMGVEQVYVDAFTRAKEYEAKKKSGAADFRKDLEMETMIEVLNAKRFITCHSYVQSEINMLMHVADDMGFTVNTFTHILEGYKLADKLKAHGAGASSFSDWWAYKYEVIDAIPYNGAILNEVGVVTAFNSDDAEMARRLNQEAAKAVLYGGVSEEDAWKFVTLNPAKLLHIDNRVGSIKEGKDADLVIWSDHPMSIYAKAEKTFIDGIKFFDREEDKERQKEIQAERARLIQKSLGAKSGGAKTQKPRKKWHKHYHCDDAEDEMVD